MRVVRVSRKVSLAAFEDFVISVELPPSATRFDVADAVVELDRIAPLVEGICPSCGSARGTVHQSRCPLAPDDLIELCRRDAIKDGMAP